MNRSGNEKSSNLLVVCGPTASGKTRLAVRLALEVDGEIISADSRQVYRGMDLGTGKDLDEYHTPEGTVPCHLVDIVEPSCIYTVQEYQRDFYRAFEAIHARGKLPVMAGGTGLYIEAVLRGYRIPDVAEDAGLRRRLMRETKENLIRRLRDLDPTAPAHTDLSSKKRIVRAVEVASAGTKRVPPGPRPELRPLVLATRRDRRELRERIDRRLDERFDCGMVDEVRRIMHSSCPPGRFAMFGMEYRSIAEYLRGETDFEQMKTRLRHAIHRLAKRQETWFRGMERRGIRVHWIDNADEAQARRLIQETRWEK